VPWKGASRWMLRAGAVLASVSDVSEWQKGKQAKFYSVGQPACHSEGFEVLDLESTSLKNRHMSSSPARISTMN